MAEHADEMRLILSLDPSAHLCYSTYTDKWFVSARIDVTHDGLLSGIVEHRDTVRGAIDAFLHALKLVGNTDETRFNQAIKATPQGEPRYYTWNGAAFAECIRPTDR